MALKVDVSNDRIGVHYSKNRVVMAEMFHSYMCEIKLSDGLDIFCRSWENMPSTPTLNRRFAKRLRAMADTIDSPLKNKET